MASKKSKILAIAFCAAVMAGIHVNPVLAAEIPVNNGSVTVGYKDFETTTGYEEDSQVTITNIASQKDLAQETADREKKDAEHDSAIKNETLDREAADNKIKADLQADINAKEEQSKDRDSQLQANIDAETQERVNADNALNGKIDAETQERVNADNALNGKIDAETQERVNADNALNGKIDAETQERVNADNALNGKIDAETQERVNADNALNGKIDAETQERVNADNALNGRISNISEVIGVEIKQDLENAYSGTNYISDAENMVEADVILDREISRVDGRVDRLENRVDGLEDRIDKVGAMSAAIANLRTMGYDPAAPTEVAVGVGQYRDETGMALGLFHYPNRDFMLSLSVSTSGDEYMGGIGATWKFGRKSPEKVAEIKKAQAEADARRAEEQKLAKAEEMKKAAKEAKVQAQMERHAKLAAERAALEEA